MCARKKCTIICCNTASVCWAEWTALILAHRMESFLKPLDLSSSNHRGEESDWIKRLVFKSSEQPVSPSCFVFSSNNNKTTCCSHQPTNVQKNKNICLVFFILKRKPSSTQKCRSSSSLIYFDSNQETPQNNIKIITQIF